MAELISRDQTLEGPTYIISEIDPAFPTYITINAQDGRPHEVFVRCESVDVFEHTATISVLITRALRAGESLRDIAHELQEMQSPKTQHFISGGGGECPSLAARIGMIFEAYLDEYGEG